MAQGSIAGEADRGRLPAAVHGHEVDVDVDEQVGLGGSLVDLDLLALVGGAQEGEVVRVLGVVLVQQAARLEGVDINALRETMDKLKDKLKSAAVVLASVADGKVTLIAGVTADLTGKVKAGELVNMVAQQVGGKGGGRPDMAQAGGTQPENLAAALASVTDWVAGRL